jgi:hypothetical protein
MGGSSEWRREISGKEQSLMANKQNTGAWSGILGGLSGGVLFFWLAIAVF